jgi:hypothetical protein
MTTDQTPEPREPEDYPSIEDAYLALDKATRVAIFRDGDAEAIATWQRAAGYVEEDETL